MVAAIGMAGCGSSGGSSPASISGQTNGRKQLSNRQRSKKIEFHARKTRPIGIRRLKKEETVQTHEGVE